MIPLPVGHHRHPPRSAEAVGGLEIDILVNNAGVSATGNILDAEEASVDAMVGRESSCGCCTCAAFLLPGMVERDLGHVVNISSIAGPVQLLRPHCLPRDQGCGCTRFRASCENDCIGKRIRVTEILPWPGRDRDLRSANLGGTPEAMKEAWETFYEGYESITTKDIADTIEFAIDAPWSRQSWSHRGAPHLPGARWPRLHPSQRLRERIMSFVLPETTLGVVAHAAGDLRVEHVCVDCRPTAEQAVIEIAYGGVCGSDLHYWDARRGGGSRF